ncbi:MAG: helix-turn-helix transcriptional regulator [Steroidobacteraceae bacterium]
MTNTQKLLDRAREMCLPPTDYQLGKRLAVSRSRLSQWRTGKTTPDNEVAWKLAKILGLPTTDVIAYFEVDRAKSPTKRAWWEAQLPRVLSSLAIAVALCSSATGGSLSDERSTTTALQPIHYAKYLGDVTLRVLSLYGWYGGFRRTISASRRTACEMRHLMVGFGGIGSPRSISSASVAANTWRLARRRATKATTGP